LNEILVYNSVSKVFFLHGILGAAKNSYITSHHKFCIRQKLVHDTHKEINVSDYFSIDSWISERSVYVSCCKFKLNQITANMLWKLIESLCFIVLPEVM